MCSFGLSLKYHDVLLIVLATSLACLQFLGVAMHADSSRKTKDPIGRSEFSIESLVAKYASLTNWPDTWKAFIHFSPRLVITTEDPMSFTREKWMIFDVPLRFWGCNLSFTVFKSFADVTNTGNFPILFNVWFISKFLGRFQYPVRRLVNQLTVGG